MEPLPGDDGCRTDLECGAGLICLRPVAERGGACQLGDCNVERTCPGGLLCIPDEFKCEHQDGRHCSVMGCPDGQMCNIDNGVCETQNGPICQSETDCDQGLCLDGVCYAVECAEDSHCSEGEACDASGFCVALIEGCIDLDGDGYGEGASCMGADCDEHDPAVHTGIVEDSETLCGDGIDNNCDGRDIPCGATDADQDGFPESEDCDDQRADVNPGRSETPYNGRDDDCDPSTSDNDLDADGVLSERVGGRDCDDTNPLIYPDAIEIPGNGIDENCDGIDRVLSDIDGDFDGFSPAMGDCNDDDRSVNPSTNEVPYNGRDDDCNPTTSDDDLDEDGFRLADDCNDANPDINPLVREIFYNNIDDDCNPVTNDDDVDGDGYRANHVGGSDCDDLSSTIHPDADEVPYNATDDDCSLVTPDDDLDGDGVPIAEDCDDTDREISPNAIENGRENCGDGIDDNCRGGDVPCDAFATDSDGDGISDEDDCEPLNPNVPGIFEILGNGIDDDCDETSSDFPSQCLDDPFDLEAENSMWVRATRVVDGNTRQVQYEELVLCPYDEDWYMIDLGEGDGVEFDITFRADEGDLDLQLYHRDLDGAVIPLDTSRSKTANETVYLRRHGGTQPTYYARVYRSTASGEPTPYGLTVNVFEACADDIPGPSAEHNDVFSEAKAFPPDGERRIICPFDDDWYYFDVLEQSRVALHLLFEHAKGDLDFALFDDENNRLSASVSITDDEFISFQVQPGRYYVRVDGFSGSTNDYVVVQTIIPTRTARVSIHEPRQLRDYRRGAVGTTLIPLAFQAPDGAFIRRLVVRDLLIEHSFLNDLRISAQWNGVERAVLWNHNGDYGLDGGFDDDFLPFTSHNINFDHRTYSNFSGLPATGEFLLRVDDWVEGDGGQLTHLEVEIEYFRQPLPD
jgi:hypothetical protein